MRLLLIVHYSSSEPFREVYGAQCGFKRHKPDGRWRLEQDRNALVGILLILGRGAEPDVEEGAVADASGSIKDGHPRIIHAAYCSPADYFCLGHRIKEIR